MPTGVAFPDLPVVDVLVPLHAALASRRRAVLMAPPGAGKTTLVPLSLLDAAWLGDGRIVMLEPRRLATRAAAQRMSSLAGTDVGGLVGYQTRDERRIGPSTRIEVLTEGVLTRRLQTDPELPGVAAVIFDEVHERNLSTDLGLAFALEVADSVRPDLRLMAMSATIDASRLAAHLGGDEPVDVIASEGRSHAIDIRWLPRGRRDRLEDAVTAAVQRALRDEHGDLLVFLPGIGEIMRTRARLVELLAGQAVDVLPLAGSLSRADQDAALRPAPPDRRRVVLATDIAETSLTVEGVRVVVDSGLAREPRHDAATGMTRLTTVSTSRDSAEQRSGRAGRLGPGVAYRLWSTVEHGTRAAHRQPEITQVDLAGFALELAAWGGDGDALRFLDRPPARAMAQAVELLGQLGAVDERGRITAVGRQMAALPLHPRLARMVVADGTALACAVAALLDERDVLRGRPDQLPVDLSLRVRIIGGEPHDRADRAAIDRVRTSAADIARRAHVAVDAGALDADRAGAVLLHAYPDRLAGRRRPGQFQMRTGSAAFVDVDDPLAHEQFIVAADLDGKKSRARIRLAAGLNADDVARALAGQVTERGRLEWDRERDDLVLRFERRLGSLRLDEQLRRPVAGEDTTAALVERVRRTRLAALGWTRSSLALRDRVNFLHRTVNDAWPDWSEQALLASIDVWLSPYLVGLTGRDELESLDIGTLLRAQLPWPAGADLDRLAPPVLDLPGGRSAPIDYGDDDPTARVRVQDLFGVATHPTVGAGRVPIVLELLSPADRPLQVTADLPGFWSGSWTEVRKEMAGRYPKHHWPLDPAAAEPRRLKRGER